MTVHHTSEVQMNESGLGAPSKNRMFTRSLLLHSNNWVHCFFIRLLGIVVMSGESGRKLIQWRGRGTTRVPMVQLASHLSSPIDPKDINRLLSTYLEWLWNLFACQLLMQVSIELLWLDLHSAVGSLFAWLRLAWFPDLISSWGACFVHFDYWFVKFIIKSAVNL